MLAEPPNGRLNKKSDKEDSYQHAKVSQSCVDQAFRPCRIYTAVKPEVQTCLATFIFDVNLLPPALHRQKELDRLPAKQSCQLCIARARQRLSPQNSPIWETDKLWRRTMG